MFEILEKLIAFKTTENNPEEIQKAYEYIASLFDSEKFDVQMFEKNGKYSQLISFKDRDALHPKILLNGHIDVVPVESEDQYKLKQEGDKITGRGTLDMKGMVAVMIEIMLELGKRDNSQDVALLLNDDEEIGGMDGAGYLAKEVGLRPEFVICPDGGSSEPWQLISKGKGILWIELIAKGKSSHSAYLWEGENAIEKLIAAIQKIKEFIGPVEPDAWKTTVNVGIIETTNKTPNKVPADARAVLDIRFTEAVANTPEELKEKIRNLVPEVEVNPEEGSSLFIADEKNPLLQQFKKIADAVTGQQVPFTHSHAAADIRYFGEIGIPGILFGAIGGGMHAAEEWVDLESLNKNKEIILKFLKNP